MHAEQGAELSRTVPNSVPEAVPETKIVPDFGDINKDPEALIKMMMG